MLSLLSQNNHKTGSEAGQAWTSVGMRGLWQTMSMLMVAGVTAGCHPCHLSSVALPQPLTMTCLQHLSTLCGRHAYSGSCDLYLMYSLPPPLSPDRRKGRRKEAGGGWEEEEEGAGRLKEGKLPIPQGGRLPYPS